MREAKDFEGVRVKGREGASFFWHVDNKDLQLSAVDRAVLVSAKVGVFEGMLMRDVNAMV